MTKIDKKDFKILQALDKDARMSFTQIGKYSGLSKETVQYRFNRLFSEDILKGFWMVPKIDSSICAYKVLIRSKGISNQSFEKIKSFLIKSPVVSWMAICNGYWNIHLTLLSERDFEISLLLKELFTTFSSFFVDIQFHKSVSVYSFSEKYLYESPSARFFYGSFLEKPVYIDKTDKKILNLLSNNARINFVEIGREIGLTPEAVLNRFKKVKQGIITLKPRINHSKLGLSYYHLWLRLSDGKLINDLISHCKIDRYCVFIMEHIGKYHLHLEIVCNEDYIDHYVSELMHTFEKVILEYDLCKITTELKIRLDN